MDCKTALLLLDFARPPATELDAEDGRALDDHLAACPDCDIAARNERRIDEHLGKAMRAVEVPDRLRNHLLNRLASDHDDRRKRWAGHGLRAGVAAAACVLLLIGSIYGWTQYQYWNRPTVNADEVWHEVRAGMVSPPERPAVEKSFKQHGVQTVLPDLNYRYLTSYGIADFQGVQVPQLAFNRDDNATHNHAVVYVLSDRQFKLKDLPANYVSLSGYQYNVTILHQVHGSFAYVIVHTGDDVEWLKNPS